MYQPHGARQSAKKAIACGYKSPTFLILLYPTDRKYPGRRRGNAEQMKIPMGLHKKRQLKEIHTQSDDVCLSTLRRGGACADKTQTHDATGLALPTSRTLAAPTSKAGDHKSRNLSQQRPARAPENPKSSAAVALSLGTAVELAGGC